MTCYLFHHDTRGDFDTDKGNIANKDENDTKPRIRRTSLSAMINLSGRGGNYIMTVDQKKR